MQITWDGVIERAGLGRFGDILIEWPDEGVSFCGPLKRIFREEGKIVFEAIWIAKRKGRGDWKRDSQTQFQGNTIDLWPRVDQEESVIIECLSPGRTVKLLSMATQGTLDPREVIGLEGDEIRQSRAREYLLPLESSWQRIVEEMNGLATYGAILIEDQIQIQKEAKQFGNR